MTPRACRWPIEAVAMRLTTTAIRETRAGPRAWVAIVQAKSTNLNRSGSSKLKISASPKSKPF
jgi:hypothetical protein